MIDRLLGFLITVAVGLTVLLLLLAVFWPIVEDALERWYRAT